MAAIFCPSPLKSADLVFSPDSCCCSPRDIFVSKRSQQVFLYNYWIVTCSHLDDMTKRLIFQIESERDEERKKKKKNLFLPYELKEIRDHQDLVPTANVF